VYHSVIIKCGSFQAMAVCAMETSADLQQVARVVADAHTYAANQSEQARTMVADGLAHALPQVGEEQHQYQKEIVDSAVTILAEALQVCIDAELNCKSVIQDSEEKLNNAKAAIEIAHAAVESANFDFKAKSGAVQVKKKEVSGLDAEHEEVEAVALACKNTLGIVTGRKENATLATKIIADVEEGVLALPIEEASASVVDFLEDVGAEKALQAAVTGALKSPPASRKAFDVVAMGAIVEAVSKGAESIETSLATAMHEEAYAEAEALGVWAIADVQRDRMNELTSLMKEAKADRQEKEEAEQAAAEAGLKWKTAVSQGLASLSTTDAKKRELEKTMKAAQRLKRFRVGVTTETAVMQEVSVGVVTETAMDTAVLQEQASSDVAADIPKEDVLNVVAHAVEGLAKDSVNERVPMEGVVEALGA